MPVTDVLQDWNGEIIRGSFCEQELQKTKQNVFRIEKVIRKKEKERPKRTSWFSEMVMI